MKQVTGNLIDLAEQGVFDVIIHGCNCQHAMGRGIAGELRSRYPQVYDADVDYSIKGSTNKLGNYTEVRVMNPGNNFIVVNGYTQEFYGANPNILYVDYNAIRLLFNRMKIDFFGRRFGIPKIGAGLANGDWGIISKIIDEEMVGEDITLVVLE